jgi:hypothetical protein
MISITLPSLYPEVLVTCLENLDASTARPFEVIVVGPHKPRVGLKNGTLVWIEEFPEQAGGVAAAHEKAFAAITGGFVYAHADDHLLENGWDNAVLSEFAVREKNGPFCLGLRHTAPHDEVHTSFGRYYANFPLMRQTDIYGVGGWLCGKFKAGYADTDLALRVWRAGGRCEWSECRPLRQTQQNVRSKGPEHEIALREDEQLLLRLWPDLAAAWTPNIRENPERHPGRDFNISIDPLTFSGRDNLRSLFCPTPEGFWRMRNHAAAI